MKRRNENNDREVPNPKKIAGDTNSDYQTGCLIVNPRSGDTTLHLAAEKGDINTCREILQQYPDAANHRNSYRKTPADHAASKGYYKIWKLLSNYMKEEDIETSYATLAQIVQQNIIVNEQIKISEAIISRLNNKGLEIGSFCKVILCNAARNGHKEFCALILKKYPHIIKKIIAKDYNALPAAAYGKFTEVVELLVNHMNPKEIFESLQNEKGDIEWIQQLRLFEHKADSTGLNAINKMVEDHICKKIPESGFPSIEHKSFNMHLKLLQLSKILLHDNSFKVYLTEIRKTYAEKFNAVENYILSDYFLLIGVCKRKVHEALSPLNFDCTKNIISKVEDSPYIIPRSSFNEVLEREADSQCTGQESNLN